MVYSLFHKAEREFYHMLAFCCVIMWPRRNSGTVKQCDLIFKHFSMGNYHFPKARCNSASLFIPDSGNGTLTSQWSGFKR